MILNYWHFIVLFIIVMLSFFGIYKAIKQDRPKLVFPMIISILIVSLLSAVFSVIVVDKYTKIVKLYKLENKRILNKEQIMYSGIVKNEGNHKIGTVKFEIKLINKGLASGNVKGGSFYKPNGLSDFFSFGENKLYRPQQIIKEFIIARNLKAGQVKSFRVYMDFPPYFTAVTEYSEVYGR